MPEPLCSPEAGTLVQSPGCSGQPGGRCGLWREAQPPNCVQGQKDCVPSVSTSNLLHRAQGRHPDQALDFPVTQPARPSPYLLRDLVKVEELEML